MTKQPLYIQIIRQSETVLLFFLLFLFLIIKGLFVVYANPLPDEAYYWLWSKKLSLSYFDHPPLATWAQAFFLSSFDNKNIVIRALPFLSFGIVVTTMIFWQQFMHRKLDYIACLRSIVLFLGFPLFSIFFSISFPDHMLIMLLFVSSFCLFLYFEKHEINYWYFAVLVFSLALLTKYNAILFGLGVLIYVLLYRQKIKAPSYRVIIVSTIIIFIVQMPVLFWNLNNDLGSFSFHLNERLDNDNDLTAVLKNTTAFLSGVFLAFSPIFIFNLKNIFYFATYSTKTKNFLTMSCFVLIFSTAFCIFLCFFTNVLYYWLTPAIVTLIPFLNDIIKKKMWQYFHILYGILISLILFINISFYPIGAIFGSIDRETAILFGWDKIIKVVDEEKKQRGIEEVVFSDYRLGSLYIFHSGDFKADVVMEKRRTQFDVWREEKNSFGMNTLIIADKDFPIGKKILSRFDSVEFLKDIEIHIGNNLVRKYHVFLGTNT